MRMVRALAPVPVAAPAPGASRDRRWQVIAHDGHPVARWLWEPDTEPAGPVSGTAVLLGSEFRAGDNALLLRAIADAGRHRRRLALIHLGAGGTSLVRAAVDADQALRAISIELPAAAPVEAVRAGVALARSDQSGTEEFHVDRTGRVTTTRWQEVMLPEPAQPRAGRPVVVVTGGLGGLGIRAATVLAELQYMHPVLIDRRRPASLAGRARRYLQRLAACPVGATVRTADLTDARQLADALADLPGPVSAVVHCAGVLRAGTPAGQLAEDLAADQAVKVTGLRHLFAAFDPGDLRSLVVFGSILAEQRPHNLGSYALANELLRRAALRMSRQLPGCGTVVAQWAIWAGAGMAHDLGVVRQARSAGMEPITLRPGLVALRRLLAWPAGAEHAARLILTADGDEPDRNEREGKQSLPT